ncbi:hypothetical protein NE237_008536 [Protea cynaroides]|uniref:Uncharacterized protein n=1 Tax=Protea cynaroides TaxID=273540 RepID=A0A9Q0KW18_9MAGN|nr:hypothetical protein NE237_008536 [Protea cynaroides]
MVGLVAGVCGVAGDARGSARGSAKTCVAMLHAVSHEIEDGGLARTGSRLPVEDLSMTMVFMAEVLSSVGGTPEAMFDLLSHVLVIPCNDAMKMHRSVLLGVAGVQIALIVFTVDGSNFETKTRVFGSCVVAMPDLRLGWVVAGKAVTQLVSSGGFSAARLPVGGFELTVVEKLPESISVIHAISHVGVSSTIAGRFLETDGDLRWVSAKVCRCNQESCCSDWSGGEGNPHLGAMGSLSVAQQERYGTPVAWIITMGVESVEGVRDEYLYPKKMKTCTRITWLGSVRSIKRRKRNDYPL